MTNTKNALRRILIGSIALIALFAAASSALFFASPSAAQTDGSAVVEESEVSHKRHGRGQRGNFGKHGAASEVVADALGITVEELEAAREEGTKLSELAEELGVDMADIYAAQQVAAEAAINEAVANGELTQEKADALLERMALKALARQVIDKAVVKQAVADTLGLTVEEIDAAKEDGTLRELAEENGITREDVKAAKQAAVEEMIAQAVADGTLTQAQADEILAGAAQGKRGHGKRGHGRGHGKPAAVPVPSSLDA